METIETNEIINFLNFVNSKRKKGEITPKESLSILNIVEEFEKSHKENYIRFENATMWVEGINNEGIVHLYDEDRDENKKVPLEEVLNDYSFQGY